MLIASYPVFEKALASGKTLLDLALVHSDVRLSACSLRQGISVCVCSS